MPCSLALAQLRMVSMLSCLALSMKPQVLITTTLWSPCSDSWSTAMPLAFSWAIITSLSKVFFEQPKVITFTLVRFRVLAFMRGADQRRGARGSCLHTGHGLLHRCFHLVQVAVQLGLGPGDTDVEADEARDHIIALG